MQYSVSRLIIRSLLQFIKDFISSHIVHVKISQSKKKAAIGVISILKSPPQLSPYDIMP